MWYLITFGAGLLVGVAFLIWALRERSVRQKAEQERDKAKEDLRDSVRRLALVQALVEQLQLELKQSRDTSTMLRLSLQETQKMLLQCNDPATIKTWLDEEMKKTTP